MDVFSTQSLEAMLEAERAKEKKKMPSSEELANTLHQVALERMTLNGSPNPNVLRTLLQQHDPQDISNINAVVRWVLKTAVGSPKWYVYRFKKLVTATRFIRHVWLASRFRFAIKLQSIVAKWSVEEERARKERNRESLSKKRERAQSAEAHFDYLSIGAPPELKKKVLLTHYRNLQKEYLARWNRWWGLKKEYEKFLKDTAMMHPNKRERMLAEYELPPNEPEFRWFPALSALTHQQLFELSLRMQQSLTAKALKKERESKGEKGTDAGKDFTDKYEMEDDNWVEHSLESLGIESAADRATRQMVEESKVPVDEQHSRTKYSKITSRLFGDYDGDMDGQVTGHGGGYQEGGAKPKGGSLVDPHKSKRTGYNLDDRFAELKDMPVLSRFKTQGWHLPPRPLPAFFSHQPKRGEQKRCDPPSYAKLEPMLQTLCTRGIYSEPERAHSTLHLKRDSIRKRQQKKSDKKKNDEDLHDPSPTETAPTTLAEVANKEPTKFADSDEEDAEEEKKQVVTGKAKRKERAKPSEASVVMKSVKQELKRLPSTYCGVRDILRSSKAIEITLGIAPNDMTMSKKNTKDLVSHLTQRRRPQSSLR